MVKPKDMAEPQAGALKAMYEQVAKQHDRIDDFRAKLLGFLPFVTGIGLFALVGKDFPHPAPGQDVTLSRATPSAASEHLLAVVDLNFLVMAIGIFGAIASIGLFAHELRGIINCYMLVRIGRELEKLMNEEKQDVAYVFGPFYSQIELGNKQEDKANKQEDKANEQEDKANKQEDMINRWKKRLYRIVNIFNPVSVDRDFAALIVYSATIAAWAVLAASSKSFFSQPRLLVLAFGVFVASALIGAFILERHYSKIGTYIEHSVQHLKRPKSAD
jgi:hypothetical protein